MVNLMSRQISFFILILVLFAGCNDNPSEPAHLQVVSMISVAEKAVMEIVPVNTSSDKETVQVSYATPSGYYELEPGKYRISYKTGGTILLEHPVVLGKKSYQTLVAAGMLPDSLRKNPHTTMFTIKKVLAGSESHDPNGYMPQFIMLRDLYRGKKQKGMVRLVNASPFVKNVILKKEEQKLKTLGYPKYGEPMPVNPGNASYNFFLGSVLLMQKEIRVEPGYIHTFITGNSTSSDTSLTVATYKTASESIREN